MRGALFFVAFLCAAATAQDVSRPDPAGTPTKVKVGIYVIDISKIEGADQAMVVDFAVRLTWKDPRVAGPRVVGIDEVWAPRVQLADEQRIFKKLKEVVHVGADGTMLYRQRYYGKLGSPVDLSDFPFDKHTLGIELVLLHPADEVQLVLDEDVTGQKERMSIPDWSIGKGRLRESKYTLTPGLPVFPSVTYDIPADRHSHFFFWKILLPLILIVGMSWTVFWVDPVKVGPQISVTITSMLTVMAYRFATAQFLPNLPYLTRLDVFVMGSTFLVFLALVQEVTTILMVKNDRADKALRLDRVCRWAFPAAFAVIAVLAFAF